MSRFIHTFWCLIVFVVICCPMVLPISFSVVSPSLQQSYNYTPRFNEVERGVYWYHLVRLSVCPSVDRIVSALYLQEYSLDPFHICTSYQATSEGVSRVMPVSKFKNSKIFLICNFDFVFFWLGIQYDSMVWVIMRRRGCSQNAGVLVVLVAPIVPAGK